MKRVFGFLLVLILLGATLLGVTAFSLIKESDNVTFTAVDEWGDRGYLRGLTAEMNFSFQEKLNWRVKFIPFEKTETEYDYDTIYPLYVKGGNNYIGFAMPSLGLIELKNENPELKALVDELKAQTAESGEMTAKEIKFRDYYEYYPVYVDLYLPGITIDWQRGFGADERGQYSFGGISAERGQGFINAFREYFRVPVSESDVCEIKVMPSEHNGISYHSSRDNSFDFSFRDVRTENTVYFTFDNEIYNHEGKRELVDTSLIPGGYGIYALPYSKNDIKYEELRTVYSIPSDANVESFSVDEERKELYLGLQENEKFVLHVIDIATMTDKTVIELFDFTCDDFVRVSQNEDFFVFIKNDIDFNVVSSDDDGKWKSALTGTMPAGSSVHREYFSYDSSFAFDGERLVVWVFEQPGMEDTQILSLQPDVMVFTENGLQYYCKWLCSLGDPVANVVRWEAVSVGEWRIMLQ